MSYRDLIVLGIVAFAIPGSFRVPFTGLLCFSWLAYMRAQDLCWGIARTARLSYIVAFTMLVGFFAHEFTRRSFTQWDVRTRCMLALGVVIGIGILDARQFDDYVQGRYLEYLKILAIALFTAGQVNTQNRLRLMVWTITISLGFFGVKNGLWGIATGGRPIVRGPGGMLEDNNDFALAMVMNIPLLLFMGRADGRLWVRRATEVATLLTMITVFCTYSRGALLSMMGVVGIFVLRSRYKTIAIVAALVGAGLFFVLAPDALKERYGMITDYEGDASAMGRLMAWGVAWRMIQANPVMGVGLRNFRANFDDYGTTNGGYIPEVHNSWLQVWAEGGSIAFVLYLVMILSAFWTLRRLIRIGRNTPGGAWIVPYALMFEASLIGFCIGATFLNRGHFDLAYHVLSLVTALSFLVAAWLRLPAEDREPVEDEHERPPLEVVGRGRRRFRRPDLRVGPSWSR